MARIPRPHIPISVRLKVAERMVGFEPCHEANKESRLMGILAMLFGAQKYHLDHDPPLAARERIIKGGKIVGYKPDANDPDYLIYRTVEEHRVKTNIRGEHGQYPDRVLIKRERRRNAKRKPTVKIRSRSRWPAKGSRPINWRKKNERV